VSRLPVKINVEGGLSSFDLTGAIGGENHFNSRWLLNRKLTLDRAILTTDSKAISPLPDQAGVELNLPPMDGAQWLALFQNGAAMKSAAIFSSRNMTLRTPSLTLGWPTVEQRESVSQPVAGGSKVEAQGREINATLTMREMPRGWQFAISITTRRRQKSASSETIRLPVTAWISAAGRICSCAARSAGCGDKNMAVSTAISRLKAIP
jgi:uncharacterized protein YhdP